MNRKPLSGSIYENPKILELANRCKMGDIEAMLDMAQFFKSCCSEYTRERIDAYETEPTEENAWKILYQNRSSASADKTSAKAYMMWIIRAAVYGNAEAEKLLERCAYYKSYEDGEFLSYKMLTNEEEYKIWASDFLWQAGIVDMVYEHEGDCGMIFCKKKGYFLFRYAADLLCEADETGFGEEREYENACYNEFFCRIPKRGETSISQKLVLLENERDEYWEVPEHNAKKRKYRKRLCRQG